MDKTKLLDNIKIDLLDCFYNESKYVGEDTFHQRYTDFTTNDSELILFIENLDIEKLNVLRDNLFKISCKSKFLLKNIGDKFSSNKFNAVCKLLDLNSDHVNLMINFAEDSEYRLPKKLLAMCKNNRSFFIEKCMDMLPLSITDKRWDDQYAGYLAVIYFNKHLIHIGDGECLTAHFGIESFTLNRNGQIQLIAYA